MNAYYKGQLLCGPRGPAGPDGNPIGTVISFLGLTAPKDYLICDGAEYHIADYPELAGFFQQQFGAANHFGGDGAASFAVPDMRNLFLRGYHGESQEPLSGDVGEKQEATRIPNIYVADYGRGFFAGKNPSLDGNWPDHVDMEEPQQSTYSKTSATVHSGPVSANYTTRPVNMAVLFCIKAAESVPAENVYSTEETRIGTWIDGRPLYLITKTGTISSESLNAYAPPIGFAFPEQIDPPIYLETSIYSGNITCFGEQGSIESIVWNRPNNRIEVYLTANTYIGSAITCTIRYTKPTDQAVIELPDAVAPDALIKSEEA